MKSLKKLIPVILLGLLLVAFAVVTAQTPSQGEQKKKTETCCAMETCCCNNGSCPMKKEGAANTEGKHECCACCAESCDMNMKHEQDAKGDCCNAKHKNKHKAKKAA